MPILTVIIVLVVIGLLLGAITRWLPMSAPIKNILVVVVAVATVIWVMSVFGLFAYIDHVRVGPIHHTR